MDLKTFIKIGCENAYQEIEFNDRIKAILILSYKFSVMKSLKLIDWLRSISLGKANFADPDIRVFLIFDRSMDKSKDKPHKFLINTRDIVPEYLLKLFIDNNDK